MENVTRTPMSRSEEVATFSSGLILPIAFILSAFGIMCGAEVAYFPFLLRMSAFAFFMSACLWDFKGLFYACSFICVASLGICPRVFLELPCFIFFLIMLNTSFIVALLKKAWMASQKVKAKELERLKAWETHYYAFRLQCLEKLEEVKKVQEEFFFMQEQVESLEKERLEGFLEEEESLTRLMQQLADSEEQCLLLQQEVDRLEEIISTAAPISPASPLKVLRKKKAKEPSQATLF